jgi:uncharacterized protein DUF6599
MLLRAVARRSEGRGESEERIFVRDGLRSFRRTFRVAEVYWGLGTGAVLLGILGWVSWKGAHPDPSLFDMSAALSGSSPAQLPVAAPASRRAGERLGAPRATGDEAPGGAAAEPSASAPASETTGVTNDRGPLPKGLASDGFHEGKLSAYTSDNLYIKIDGRASYFQSFGVKTMHTVTLEGAPEGAGTSVDIEVYDLGESRNAIGAYNGERPPGLQSIVADGSTYHFDRNAAFLARGPYYVRVIGSDESAQVVAEVRRLIELFRREIRGEALPWGFALFVDQLKLPASAVTYVKSNAFSFGFARDVYKVTLSAADSKDDTEAFVVASADAEAARALEKKYSDGFASMGAAAGSTQAHARLFKDEFLGTFSAVMPVERWLIGVRGAVSVAQASEVLASLEHGLAALPPEVRARAVPSAGLDEPEGEPDPGVGGPAELGSAEPGSAEPGSAEPSAAQGTGRPESPEKPASPEKNADPPAAPGKAAEEESHEL